MRIKLLQVSTYRMISLKKSSSEALFKDSREGKLLFHKNSSKDDVTRSITSLNNNAYVDKYANN